MTEALPLLILLPFTASLFCLLARLFRRPLLARIVAAVSVAGSLLILGLLLPVLRNQGAITYSMGGWLEPLGIALYLDALAWTTSVMGTVVGLCALLFAFGEGRYRSDFFFFFLMLLAGMEGVILTVDLFNLFVFIEIVSIASYILIAYFLNANSLWAALRYLLLSSLSVAVFLLGLFLVYQATGTFSLRLIAANLSGGAGLQTARVPETAQILALAAAALTVGIGLKAAFVPLHTWLPEAHAVAPHPVSALLSGVMIKISFLAVWRILSAFAATGMQALFRWLGPATALLAVILALSQTDSKRLLAFHSVSQMGLIAAAFGAASQAGTSALIASLAHILSHSLFKSLLFLSVGSLIHLTGERNLERYDRSNPRPWLLAFFAVGALSISGLPPFNGFVSKTLVSSLFKTSPLLATALRLTAVGTAASMIKLSGMFRWSRKSGNTSISAHTPAGNLRMSPWCICALSLLALLCLAGGLAPRFMTEMVIAPAVGAARSSPQSIYTTRHLAEAAATAAVGGMLYLLVRTSFVRRMLKMLRGLRLSLDSALLLVVVAVLLFAAAGGVFGGFLRGALGF
ncbi:MAG: hypothetical protein JSV89_15470 [Spirochaetaceae bacterium]|nr:MAG: hypothetical protein JSV89_15470 [Spirochaetaceae bacterium]